MATSSFEQYLAGLKTSTGLMTAPQTVGHSSWLQKLYQPAFGYVQGGSAAAGNLLRQSYEDDFRARAAGLASGQAERERAYGSQIASQGLSPDVAYRMLAEQRVGDVQALAAARGQVASGLYGDLAELAKGTGTEFAGLQTNLVNTMASYKAAKKSAKASGIGGIASGLGSLGGAVIAAG